MVEGARLESVYAGNRIAGSNPALSARREFARHSLANSLLEDNDLNPEVRSPKASAKVYFEHDCKGVAARSSRSLRQTLERHYE